MITSSLASARLKSLSRAAPGGIRTTEPFSQSSRYPTADLNRETGAIRDVPHAFSPDGGLAVLYGCLFGVMSADDYALLMGSLLVFSLLSAVMILTRNVNWSSFVSRENEPSPHN